MTTHIIPSPIDPQKEEQKTSVVVSASLKIAEHARIIRFRGRAMIETVTNSNPEFPDFKQLTSLHRDNFEALAYPLLGGISRNRMADIFSYVINTAPDLTNNDHLILFGDDVWDSRLLEFNTDISHEDIVWSSPYSIPTTTEPSPFILSLAGNDEGKYNDIMQSLAPIISYTKPDGAIWWVGSGANGKSSLTDAIYKIFPHQLASLTVKRLTDGRDTPSLNGNLANVVKESSEGRIDDTQVYKSIGTHEDFRVHKFHSQDDILIRGNMHHIFSGNSIPIFNDKGYSARRRTYIIPFTQVFESDPEFNNRTFTQTELSLIIGGMMRSAIQLRTQAYRYKFSKLTNEAKAEYDAEVNSAEEYAKDLIQQGVVAFETFDPIRLDYDQWCAQMGYTPLGITNLRKAVQAMGFERMSYKDVTGSINKRYRLYTVKDSELQVYSLARPGLYTTTGFKPYEPLQPQQPQQIDAAEGW